MRSTKVVHIVSCHAEGEVGNVIVGGVSPPPGDSVWEQSRWIENDQALRQFVLNEPRGGVFKHVNLLVPPKDKSGSFRFHHNGARAYTAHVWLKFNLCRNRPVRQRVDSDA